MTKILEHLQFALLMVPTLALLAAAAASMADLGVPEEPIEVAVIAEPEPYENQP